MDWGKFDQLLKKREAAMFYDMTEREIKAYQRRKAQHELECVERRKQFEAKWKAEDELFFLKHGITREEVLYGKKPEVPPVVIPVADTVVVASAVELVVEAEIKPDVVEAVVVEAALSPTEVVDIPIPLVDVVVVTTEDAMVVTVDVTPNEIIVPTDAVVYDFHIAEEFKSKESTLVVEMENFYRSDFVDVHVEDVQSDFLSLSTCSSPILSTLQVHHDPTLEAHIGLLDTLNPAHMLHTDVLDPVSVCGKPQHSFDDPYLVHVDVSHALCLYGCLDAFHCSIDIYIEPQDRYSVPLVKHGAGTSYAFDTELFIRILFDPGISLEFILGSHEFLHDGALFYDILLIRGRILSNREGMM